MIILIDFWVAAKMKIGQSRDEWRTSKKVRKGIAYGQQASKCIENDRKSDLE